MTTRNPLYSPVCGDVWQLDGGKALVVDYKDPFTTGATFLDGSRTGWKYTNDFAAWVKQREGKLISSFEQKPLPWNCDDRGWTKDCNEKVPTGDQSLSFLKRALCTPESGKVMGEEHIRELYADLSLQEARAHIAKQDARIAGLTEELAKAAVRERFCDQHMKNIRTWMPAGFSSHCTDALLIMAGWRDDLKAQLAKVEEGAVSCPKCNPKKEDS